ncbi:MAG: TraC family protein [bacterium]|jgi:conjugal transfer ATP-binding protein TraC
MSETVTAFQEQVGLHTKLIRALFQKNSLSKYLPYRSYDFRDGFYINDDETKGIIFEASPRIVAADSNVFEEILNNIPEGTVMQFTLYGSVNINPIIDAFERDIVSSNQLYNKLAKDYGRFLISKTKKPINDMVPNRVKNYRLLISLKFDKGTNYKNIAFSIENILKVKSFDPVRLEPKGLIQFLWEIFNNNHDFKYVPYNEHQFINEQAMSPDNRIVIKDDEVIMDGVHWGSLNIADFPQFTHISEFSQKLGDAYTANLDRQQFFDTFLITNAFQRISPGELKKVKGFTGVTMNQYMPEEIFPRLAKKKTDAKETIKNLEERKPLLKMSLSCLVAGRSEEELKENIDAVISYWSSGNDYQRMKVFRDKYIVMPTILSSLPFGVNDEVTEVTRRYSYFFSDAASQFVPAEGDWHGTKNKTIFLVSRRGQLIGFDLFDADSYNGYIVASTGAGKSVFINLLTLFYLSKGNRVWIIDVGRSYEKLTKETNGQWIEFNPQNPVSLNPFSGLTTEEEFNEYLEYLISFIFAIGAPISVELSEQIEKLVRSHLDSGLRELYRIHKDGLLIDHVSQYFLDMNDPRLKDFGQQLYPFTSKGLYGKFFSGKSNVDFTKDLVVMEFDALENIPELRDAVMMIMTFHISRSIYHDKTQSKSIVFMDEAHKFLGSSSRIDVFIEQAYRRFRKHGASMIIATQGLDDIFSLKENQLSRAGRVIIQNSAWKFFLKQTPESIQILTKSEVLPLSDYDKAVISSIRNVPPYFSEVFIMTPFKLNVAARIYLSRFIYYLFTTNKDEKDLIKNIMDGEGLTLEDAILKIVEKEESH